MGLGLFHIRCFSLLLLCGRSCEDFQLLITSFGVVLQEKKRPEKEIWRRMGSGNRRIGRYWRGHRYGAGKGRLRYNFGEQEYVETIESKKQN